MTASNHYGASSWRAHNEAPRLWSGWVQFPPTSGQRIGQMVETPHTYPTKRAALAAIKAQHPQETNS